MQREFDPRGGWGRPVRGNHAVLTAINSTFQGKASLYVR